MSHALPDYAPPDAQRAAIAVGLAPILVLAAFTLIVCGLIDAEVGLAVFVACTAWVVVEMHRYQRAIDAYDEDYVRRHLAWRSPVALREAALAPATAQPTLDFVGRFVETRVLPLRDGQRP